ncbi:MAG: efflux RND transporter periplasmic adaptor subunit [Deltaproteobacteria bacterium]|nr:efflux RND transporter periplasmic adaptor subunit [Deltaproteobacteria bacterium]
MKKFFLLLLYLLIIATGWKVYQKIQDPAASFSRRRMKRQVPVEITKIRRGTIREMGVFTGSLKPKSRFIVAPKITGRLKKLLVNIGDNVKPGQLIALLDDEEFELQLQQAMAHMEVARANQASSISGLKLSKRELKRMKKLRASKMVSVSELDAAEVKYSDQQGKHRTAKAQLAEKQAAVEVSRLRLSYTQVKILWNASQTGMVVGERFVDEGALLSPNAQIVSVLDISSLTAVINITERDYFKLKIGQTAVIMADALGQKQFKGKITRISPLIKETSREAKVEIEIPNIKRFLRPGLFIRALIHFDTHGDSQIVPLTALVKRNNTVGVFLADLKNKKATFVPVEVGITENSQAEIIKPLLQGHVVTLGQHLLEDGSGIMVPGTGKKKPSIKKQKPRS